jgi:type IV pilus assembly protein PilC
MSGQAGEPRPPRKPKTDRRPPSPPPPDTEREPTTDVDAPSTFKPNPNRTKKPRSTVSDVKLESPGKGPSWWERILFGSVGSGQLATFCRQFAAYQNAGVDISKSLANLGKQFAGTSLGPVIGRISMAVKRGDTLAESMAREPQAFDALFVGMIKVAEARGGIPETLRLLGRHYESRQSLMRQARSALIYPVIVLVLACGVVALLTVKILPMFASLIRDVAGPGTNLPLPSRILMALSDFVQVAGWLLIPVVFFGTPILLFQAYKTSAGKRVMDGIALVIPVFGALLAKLDTARFARTLATLLNAGVDVGSSLELTSDVLRLEPYRRAVSNARLQVIQGEELSEALDHSRRFAPEVIAVINSGEETGKLPESLNHVADDFEERIEYTVRNMGQLIQPLMTIVLGGIVLFIILAVILPLISLMTSLAKPGG